MAVKECYTNYQQVDYNKPYDLLSKHNSLPESVIDHDRFGLDQQDPVQKVWPAIANVKSMMFRYQAHQTSNDDNSRNILRYGRVTADIECVLWGFETYLEFKDHLLIQDKQAARDLWEELKCIYAGNHVRCLFWVPKMDANTRPGCWAISIDQATQRSVVVWANDDYHWFGNLRLTKQNQIKLEIKNGKH